MTDTNRESQLSSWERGVATLLALAVREVATDQAFGKLGFKARAMVDAAVAAQDSKTLSSHEMHAGETR